MSEKKSQEALVGDQFGARADAYLNSAVHAQGADLQALADLVRNRPNAGVLDLGCGGGHVTYNVAPFVREVVAYDLSPEMLSVVAKAARDRGFANVTTVQGVAEELPFEAGRFDFVLSRYSAHHWRDFEAGVREVARVLKPGGVAGLVDSISPGEPLLDTYYQAIELLRDCSHVRDYSRAEWEAAIVRAGLLLGLTRQHRVHLEFQSWVERMRTPTVQVDAIRAIQTSVSSDVAAYFETEPDGSFTFDVAVFEASRPA